MAMYSRIHCEHCGPSFEVYSREVEKSAVPIRCSHCLTQMTKKQWEAFVDAYFTTLDLNYQAIKSHEEHGKPLFTVELVYKRIPRDLIRLD